MKFRICGADLAMDYRKKEREAWISMNRLKAMMSSF